MDKNEIRLLATLDGHMERIWCVRWHPNGHWLTSCGADRTIKIWAENKGRNSDKNEWKCISTLTDGHQRTIRYISWSHDGRYLASASFDGTTCIWHQQNSKKELDQDPEIEWTVMVSLEGHENEIKCVSWSSNDQFLATCSRDKSVWIWEKIEIGSEAADSSMINDSNEEAIFECSSVLNEHSQDVKCVVWHPNLNILASSSFDNQINLYCQTLDDWQCYANLYEHESTVWSVAFNKNGTRLVSVSADESIKIFEPKNYQHLIESIDNITSKEYAELTQKWVVIASLNGYHQWPIYDVQWFNNYILTVGADNSIHVFKQYLNNLEDSKEISVRYRQLSYKTDAHEQDINSVNCRPMKKQSDQSDSDDENLMIFATGSDDGFIRLWSMNCQE